MKDLDAGFKLALSSLEQTKPNVNIFFKNNIFFSISELRILNSLAYYFVQIDEFEKAKKILINIITRLDNFLYNDDKTLYIRCICNLLIILITEGNYLEIINYSDKCIEICKKNNITFQLGHLYGIKAYALYNINNFNKKYGDYLNKSIALFDVLEQKNNLHLAIECKELLKYGDLYRNTICELSKKFN
jgi:tetratricopeptide (TPR) repeat protein